MNNELFIKKILVKKIRDLKNFEISLSETKRKHLIITGKNGSGKTSLLLEINKFLRRVNQNQYQSYVDFKEQLKQFEALLKNSKTHEERTRYSKNINQTLEILISFGETSVFLSDSERINNKKLMKSFLIIFLDAKRSAKLLVPTGINRIDFKEQYDVNDTLGSTFIQHIVNLKAERSFARDDQDESSVNKIDKWFHDFEQRLQYIFDAPNLRLVFDRKKFNFTIDIDGQEPFDFSELSDGYSAILSIVTELIMRMEAFERSSYDLEGIVLIDEIENHLHVDLQKKILPFLCDFFPKIQFIVSTHSPFVLSSVSNAVICDLENKIVTDDLSGYSYDALIESYFGIDKYSAEVKEKLAQYRKLSQHRPTDEDKDKYFELKQYFNALPKYLAPELQAELQQIQLSTLG